MRRTSYYVRWGGSRALELQVSGDVLTVRGANFEITFEPRSVIVEAKYSYKKEVEDTNRKTLIIGFAEPLEPLEAPRVDILGRNYVGNFEVIHTDLGFEKYLTVITPASHVYDYAVLTSHELLLHMKPRRKIYFEEEPYDKIIIYLV